MILSLRPVSPRIWPAPESFNQGRRVESRHRSRILPSAEAAEQWFQIDRAAALKIGRVGLRLQARPGETASRILPFAAG